MSDYVDWLGQSGNLYRYWFLANPTADGIQAVAGNYNFVKRLANGMWFPLYFGEAKDLSDRIPGHELWEKAVALGATHVMAHTKPAGEQARLAEEADLIRHWNPPLNKQHRTTG